MGPRQGRTQWAEELRRVRSLQMVSKQWEATNSEALQHSGWS